jgi:hypothetical protein
MRDAIAGTSRKSSGRIATQETMTPRSAPAAASGSSGSPATGVLARHGDAPFEPIVVPPLRRRTGHWRGAPSFPNCRRDLPPIAIPEPLGSRAHARVACVACVARVARATRPNRARRAMHPPAMFLRSPLRPIPIRPRSAPGGNRPADPESHAPRRTTRSADVRGQSAGGCLPSTSSPSARHRRSPTQVMTRSISVVHAISASAHCTAPLSFAASTRSPSDW